MKTLTLLSTIALYLMGCSLHRIEPEQTFSLMINDNATSYVKKVSASKTCRDISISSIDFGNSLDIYNLDLKVSPKGNLISLILITRAGKRYETQAFDPQRYVSLSNFMYDDAAKTVSLTVTGKLFAPHSTDEITVKGEFHKLNVALFECNQQDNSLDGTIQGLSKTTDVESTFTSTATETFNLNTINPTLSYFQHFYLTNYFKITFRAKTPYKRMPPGTYSIESNSNQLFDVFFEEYKGLSTPENFGKYVASEWRSFDIKGTVTISEQYTLNDKSYTFGTLNFEAVNKSDGISYVLTNGKFKFFNF
jgi:hypothetical protein